MAGKHRLYPCWTRRLKVILVKIRVFARDFSISFQWEKAFKSIKWQKQPRASFKKEGGPVWNSSIDGGNRSPRLRANKDASIPSESWWTASVQRRTSTSWWLQVQDCPSICHKFRFSTLDFGKVLVPLVNPSNASSYRFNWHHEGSIVKLFRSSLAKKRCGSWSLVPLLQDFSQWIIHVWVRKLAMMIVHWLVPVTRTHICQASGAHDCPDTRFAALGSEG